MTSSRHGATSAIPLRAPEPTGLQMHHRMVRVTDGVELSRSTEAMIRSSITTPTINKDTIQDVASRRRVNTAAGDKGQKLMRMVRSGWDRGRRVGTAPRGRGSVPTLPGYQSSVSRAAKERVLNDAVCVNELAGRVQML